MTTEIPDRRRTALVVRLVLLGVVVVLAGIVLAARDSSLVSPALAAEEAGPDALAAASAIVPAVYSYDWRNLERSRTAATTMTAGPFAQRYLSVFDETIARPATEQQLSQTATVLNAGLVEASSASARVLMLVQFSAQRQSTGQVTNAPGLLSVQMERGPSGWLMAEMNPTT